MFDKIIFVLKLIAYVNVGILALACVKATIIYFLDRTGNSGRADSDWKSNPRIRQPGETE